MKKGRKYRVNIEENRDKRKKNIKGLNTKNF